uniref:Transcription repressor n=1 Tax=Kalanchoe fedtschenkoi TaxID=63787 RepID=A0A7N0UD24_KALFE
MPPSTHQYKNHRQCQCRGCGALCCSSSFSTSSSDAPDRGRTEERRGSISSLAHAMVQERLGQMIREREEARRLEEEMKRRRRRKKKWRKQDHEPKLVLVVAVERPSYDPGQDFRESVVEMIETYRIIRPRDLRWLLDCYLSVNSDELREVILDAFHKVCTDIFM